MRENILNIRRGSRTGSQLLPFKLPFWISSLVCAHPSRFQARGLALGSLTSSEPNPGVSATSPVVLSGSSFDHSESQELYSGHIHLIISSDKIQRLGKKEGGVRRKEAVFKVWTSPISVEGLYFIASLPLRLLLDVVCRLTFILCIEACGIILLIFCSEARY